MMRDMTVLDTMTLTPCGLASLIRESINTTLIVDCRAFTEYNESHIKLAINAFFSKLIRRRLFENKLDDNCLIHQLMSCLGDKNMEEKLDLVLYAEEDKPRGNKRRIASCNAPESSAKILRVLRERLEDTDKFRSVMILDGGYKQFAGQYPQHCDSSEGMTRLPQSLSQPCLSNPNGDGITLITSNIYLGSQIDSLDEKMLKALDITAVINLSVTCPKSVCITNEENFLRIPVNDSYQEKLSPYFPKAFDFLEKIRLQGRKCLIHCLAGISRSPTLCISYIMKSLKLGSDDAYRYVKDRRPSISPNFNFMGQLLEYESTLIREQVLKPEQTSRHGAYRLEKSMMLDCLRNNDNSDLCPPKVPKSASSHCVFTPSSPSSSEEPEPTPSVNMNGKRCGVELHRPRALGLLSGNVTKTELPSPSSEFSRLSFETNATSENAPGIKELTFSANPLFLLPQIVPPMKSTSREIGGNGSQMENPMYDVEPGTSGSVTAPVAGSGSKFNFFRFKKCCAVKSCRTSRPDSLRSAGVMLNTLKSSPTTTTSVLTTTEEEVESPESGFAEEMKSCPDDDSVSIGSASSLEISCK